MHIVYPCQAFVTVKLYCTLFRNVLLMLFFLFKYYMKNGTCKYGNNCKFHHPIDRSAPTASATGSPQQNVKLTLAGLPRREVYFDIKTLVPLHITMKILVSSPSFMGERVIIKTL